MKYNIIGWYGRQNCGDEAFKLAFPILLRDEELKFSESEDQTRLNILGGGDVIKPYYLDKLKGPFYIIGTGLGYESEVALLRGKDVKKAFFRNRQDAFLARVAGVPAEYIPDIVFALKPYEKSLPEKKKAIVVLNGAIIPRNSHTDNAEIAYAEYFMWSLARSLKELSQWYDIEFLPFSDDRNNNDNITHLNVVSRAGLESKIYEKPCSPEETMQKIANAHLVVTMKFHGVIFSVLNGTPFINVGFSRKCHQFCKEEGLEKLSIAPYSYTHDKFMEAVKVAESTDSALLLAMAEEKRNILLSTKFF